MSNRDKYLTEAMGECWHERAFGKNHCNHCKETLVYDEVGEIPTPNNFSTWQGFGKLWEWAQKQGWWSDFLLSRFPYITRRIVEFINPDRFSNAVYEYLKERNK